jgi:malate dehydrogenase (oxaloacetate-decarboxylating)(NADP+)
MNKVTLRGIDLLKDPLYNKENAFTNKERKVFKLEGFLPPGIENEEIQVSRAKMQLSHMTNDLAKYIYLASLQAQNETVFYRLLMSEPATYLPLIYDPTVGEACSKFGHIYRGTRGMYISIKNKGNIKEILKQWPRKDVRFIVVTDGERILGLGDLGVNGMGIPIGKLALYTAVAGVPPESQFPIFFDVGTNRERYLNDPLYMGLRHPRVDHKEYSELMDEFVDAVQEIFPKCCIQFEDFANYNAIPLLAKYRNKICMFNDDIQGTASVTLATFYAAQKYTEKKISDHKILFLGAGSAARGIADLLCYAMQQEGLSIEEAQKKCWMFDTRGLVVKGRKRLEEFKKPYAHKYQSITSFLDCIKKIKPTAIVGVSTCPNLFTKEVIEAMAELNETPLILPLSNPTSQEECTAEEAYRHSKGNALFAAGVLFGTVRLDDKIYYPAQANNLWIFPAVGMAIYATEAKFVTDEMFLVAAKTLAEQLNAEELSQKTLLPSTSRILEIALQISVNVAKVIFDNDLARVKRPDYDSHILQFIEKKMYHPFYKNYLES